MSMRPTFAADSGDNEGVATGRGTRGAEEGRAIMVMVNCQSSNENKEVK